MKKPLFAIPFSAMALVAVACSHNESEPSPPMTTAGQIAAQPVSMSDVNSITNERCSLADRCANIGPGRSYATREVCEKQAQADEMNELTNQNCPYGVDQGKLHDCLQDLRTQHCGNPIDKLSSVHTCSHGNLCPH